MITPETLIAQGATVVVYFEPLMRVVLGLIFAGAVISGVFRLLRSSRSASEGGSDRSRP